MNAVTHQDGIASSTPSGFKRWFLSRLMTHAISEKRQDNTRKKREAKRQKDGRRHVVEYFHQVDDGFSHLAMQVLSRLQERYDIDLIIHLVPGLHDTNFPEPDLLQEMSLRDAALISPYYGLDFPDTKKLPRKDLCNIATSILCKLDADQFGPLGAKISDSLWRNDEAALGVYAQELGVATADEVSARLRAGSERRKKLKHYGGAMFWYEGEWYWGVDRLYHLEARLNGLGPLRAKDRAPIAARPQIPTRFGPGARELTLEYYLSLRSPYTAVSWAPTLRLARASGVNLEMRPVLPMVMRGVPATLEKAFYVFKDAAREARAQNIEFGNFYDPIGEPVMQGYSLYMWALEQGKGTAFLGSFLNAAFAKGVNATKREGLKKIVEMAGLKWADAQNHLSNDTWQEILEENRLRMYGFGSWGVPSYRLLDRDGKELLGVWGQDRLWLVSKKIEEYAA